MYAGHKTNCQNGIGHVITSMDLCLLKLSPIQIFVGLSQGSRPRGMAAYDVTQHCVISGGVQPKLWG